MGSLLLRCVTLVVVSWFIVGCASMTPYKTIELTQVVDIPGHSQKDIYNKTRQWFSQYFVSGKSVVDYEDPATGAIIGNGIAQIGADPFGIIKYKMEYNVRIDTKDNKFRVVTKITKHMNEDTKSIYDVYGISEERAQNANNHVAKMVDDIRLYVANENTNKNADW